MYSGQLRDMIRRVYDVSNDQAQGMMDVLEVMSDNYKKTYMKGVGDGYRSAKERDDGKVHRTD